MAILSFPVTPINGQQYTSPTGTVYTYDLANTFWKSDTNIIDWTTDQGAVNINPANYVNTTYGPDLSLLYLYAAENKGNRLNMVGGIMDPFADQTDVGIFVGLIASSSKFIPRDIGFIPNVMTTNSTPFPYVASNSDGDSGAYRAHSAAGWNAVNILPGWSKIDLGYPRTITRYMMRPAAGNNYGPKAWTFEGSNDDVTWVVLDTKANITTGWVVSTNRYFTIASVSYRFYRWNVSLVNTGVTWYVDGLGIEDMAASYPTTLISNSFTASAVPTTARLGVQATGALTINTDLIGYVSRDGGTTWSTATLVLVDTLADGSAYYEDSAVSLAAQPVGTAMKYKIVTTSTNWTSTDGVLLQWS